MNIKKTLVFLVYDSASTSSWWDANRTLLHDFVATYFVFDVRKHNQLYIVYHKKKITIHRSFECCIHYVYSFLFVDAFFFCIYIYNTMLLCSNFVYIGLFFNLYPSIFVYIRSTFIFILVFCSFLFFYLSVHTGIIAAKWCLCFLWISRKIIINNNNINNFQFLFIFIQTKAGTEESLLIPIWIIVLDPFLAMG